MRKLVIIAISLMILAGFSYTNAETGEAGQAGPFMKYGLGARALGMGGAYCAIAEGIDAVYYNPAGLAFIKKRQVGFTYLSLTLDRNLNSAAVIFPVRNQAVMGLSWINSSVGGVPMIDSDRNYYDDFVNSNNAISLTFSKMFGEDLAIGANLRYLQAKLDIIDSYTVGVDIGAFYRLKKMFAFGVNIQDMGSVYQWDSSNYWSSNKGNVYNDNFPIRLRGGASATLLNKALVGSFELVKIQYLDIKVHTGAEYWFFNEVSMIVPDEESEDDVTKTSVNKRMLGLRTGFSDGSLSFGLSLYSPFGKVNGGFDYAFLTGKRGLSADHIFTVRVLF